MTKRDSNSTLKTRSSTDSQRSNKLIHVPRLKHIQRFYQFKVVEEAVAATQDEVEQLIQETMASFIETCYGEEEGVSANVVAISFKRDTMECTVLAVFDQTAERRQSVNGEEWMDCFLSFGPVHDILDQSVEPHFTQLSS